MSLDSLIIRLSGDPGTISAETFAKDALAALGPVIRPIAKGAFVPPEATKVECPQFASGLATVPDAAMPAGHAVPCSLPAAIFCAQLDASTAADWFTHLFWPGQFGQPALQVARMMLDHRPGSAKITLSLMVQGLPLSDVSFTRAGDPTHSDWQITPCADRSNQTGDWERWVAALENLDAAMTGLKGRRWNVEGSGSFETNDAQKFLALGDRLNRQASGA